jgi:hypothetical protein
VKKENSSTFSRRDFLKGAASLGAMPLLSGCDAMNKSIFGESISIRRENQKPGTRDWMLTNTRIDQGTGFFARGSRDIVPGRAFGPVKKSLFSSVPIRHRRSRWTSIEWDTMVARAGATY